MDKLSYLDHEFDNTNFNKKIDPTHVLAIDTH